MSVSLCAGNVAQYVHKNVGRVRHLSVFYTECLALNIAQRFGWCTSDMFEVIHFTLALW